MFLNEISAIMYTSGDVKEPKIESVKLMQSILKNQMNYLLSIAEGNARIRRSKIISHEDFLFIMRKKKMKLKRLIQYLHLMDLKACLNNDLKLIEDNQYVCETSKSKVKRAKVCLEFLASIEDCEELTSVIKDETIMDITAKKRKMRKYWKTYFLDSVEDEEFFKYSKVAALRPVKKFKEWLLKDQVIDLDLTECAVRIVQFLARETIAEIIDMVLCIKMEKLGKNHYSLCDYFSNSIYLDDNFDLNCEINEVPDGKSSEIPNNRGVSYKKILPICRKRTNKGESIVDNSAVKQYLSDSAKNEALYATPIEPCEIAEAFVRFQEPSPIFRIYANDSCHLPRRTNLICLAETLSFDL